MKHSDFGYCLVPYATPVPQRLELSEAVERLERFEPPVVPLPHGPRLLMDRRIPRCRGIQPGVYRSGKKKMAANLLTDRERSL